jgi:hypothetical protein
VVAGGTPDLDADGSRIAFSSATGIESVTAGISTALLFAPTVGFSGQYLQTIAGQENDVLGYTTAINPANPVAF